MMMRSLMLPLGLLLALTPVAEARPSRAELRKAYRAEIERPPMPNTERRTVPVDGVERSFLIHLPANPPRGAMPLVFVFHGLGGSATQIENGSKFSTLADQEGFIVVYPDGIDHKWLYGGQDDRDVRFFDVMLNQIFGTVAVDRSRIYTTGMSNGALFSWRLACDRAEVFAAIGFVSGAYLDTCPGAPRLPILTMHGTDDRILPYEGRRNFMPVRQFAAEWPRADDCNVTGPKVFYEKQEVTGEVWRCGETESLLYTLSKRGHSWPGGTQRQDKEGYSINATAVLWDFFAQHAKQY